MCTTGIKDQVKEYTSDKPYLKFNNNDFITVKLGAEITTKNIFEVAKSHANTLNRAINNGRTIGKVFYPESGSDVTGIGIRPTIQQLNHLNADTENEIDQTRKELEEQLAIESVKERETDLGIDEFGDSDPFFNEDDNIPKVYQKTSNENLIAGENTIRDLTARLAARIGSTVRFESDLTKDYAGYNEGNTSVINLAKATLDTPIHEIVGHPIIRTIKNNDASELYQNLLKELETGYGKEVLNKVKKEYVYKENQYLIKDFNGKFGIILNPDRFSFGEFIKDKNNKSIAFSSKEEAQTYINNNSKKLNYSLEEQQEEALVQLLGELTAGKLKETKENKGLISLLKQLLKEMTEYMRSLFNSKEIQIDKLRADMTLNDLANLLAYTNSKIILPGSKVEYTTPDNSKFSTYQEASNYVSKLFGESKDVNLSNLEVRSAKTITEVPNKFSGFAITDKFSGDGYDVEIFKEDGKFKQIHPYTGETLDISNEQVLLYYNGIAGIGAFIEKNKEFEQSKEIVDTWKKENNIQYNPEEVYSRGQGFYSSIGAYSTLELDLLLQNLLQHIEDNKKAGGQFAISAFTKPVDKRINHLEKESSVRFVIYPKSKDILWAAPTDVYSGSVWDASEKVSKDKKSELLGVSHTKAPSLNNVNEISPNLADIIDNRSHHHNELGIELTTTNFRMEADDNVPFEVKKLVNSINSILDSKYGKIIKPEINISNIEAYTVNDNMGNKVIKYFNTKEEAEIYSQELNKKRNYPDDNRRFTVRITFKSIQPTQTKENTTSIESVKSKVTNEGYGYNDKTSELQNYNYNIGKELDSKNYIDKFTGLPTKNSSFTKEQLQEQKDLFELYNKGVEALEKHKKATSKEYTSQALINTKIARLKEVAKAQPRSLITSKVVNNSNSERQYQKRETLQVEGLPTIELTC